MDGRKTLCNASGTQNRTIFSVSLIKKKKAKVTQYSSLTEHLITYSDVNHTSLCNGYTTDLRLQAKKWKGMDH